MTFSILSPHAEAVAVDSPPEYFRDLNLDQIVATITAGREEDDLAPFFQSPLQDPDTIAYRQEVMLELDTTSARQSLKAFADGMRTLRARLVLADKSHYPREKARWFLAAAETYCDVVETLADALRAQPPSARGLRALFDYLLEYAGSAAFLRLAEKTRKLAEDLAAIRYCLLIDGDKVTVRPYAGEADSSAAVESAFSKFRQDTARDYRARLADATALNHIEAQVLERVARLNPDTFGELDRFASAQADFLDRTLSVFSREILFYLAYLGYMDKFRHAGLSFCYPQLSGQDKAVAARGTYDPALAFRLVARGESVVRNDFALSDPERVLIVSGPNQGGKTTFARLFGVLHYLAALGCPVPGTEARLFLFGRIYTHFEREEAIGNLRGKLEDDLIRIHGILQRAAPNDLLIINEIFSSTSLKDAASLGKKILARISALDVLCVCVTFLDELAAFDAKTVSLVAGIDPANPAVRTFRLERRPADGLAYALAIAERYRVTYARLKERIAP